MPEGWKTITIREDIFNKISKKHNESKSSLRISPWVSDYLAMSLEKDKMVHKYAPFLEVIGEPSDVLYIKDHKDDKIVEVRMNKTGKLKSTDENPIYLQFAWALPELAKLKQKL